LAVPRRQPVRSSQFDPFDRARERILTYDGPAEAAQVMVSGVDGVSDLAGAGSLVPPAAAARREVVNATAFAADGC
jgi:hypothetical protein